MFSFISHKNHASQKLNFLDCIFLFPILVAYIFISFSLCSLWRNFINLNQKFYQNFDLQDVLVYYYFLEALLVTYVIF